MVGEMFMPPRISSPEVWSGSCPTTGPRTLPAVDPEESRRTSRIWLRCTPAMMTDSKTR